MTNRALKIGQLIANAYPADTRLLFQKYGITVQPTGKTILDAYLVFGNEFLIDLAQIASKSMNSFSSVIDTGLEIDKLTAYANDKLGAATTTTSASWIDKLFGTFNKAGETLSTASSAWDKISAIFSGNKSVDVGTGDANTALQLEMYKLQQEAAKEAASNQTKTYLLIGAALLVVVLGFFMYQKSKA